MFSRIISGLMILLLAGSAAALAQEADVKTLFVGPVRVDCEGAAPQQCLLVKEVADGEYQLFYDVIEGFDHEAGFEYELRVEAEAVENPPADASDRVWRLVEVVSKRRALQGNIWQLVSYRDANGAMVDVLPDTEITLEFGSDEVGGSGGCNAYGGGYTADGLSLEIGEIVATLIFCASEERMEQEAAYLAALNSAASYRIADNQLELLDSADEVLLVFDVLEPAPLVGVWWIMTAYNNGSGEVVSTLAGTEVSARFDAEGRVGGSAGCNSYGAEYTADYGRITIGQVVSTRMACDGAGIMEQEQAYLAALEGAVTYTIRGDVLELRNSDGLLMVRFRGQPGLVGVTWQWESLRDANGEVTAVPHPEQYTLTFHTDGLVTVLADCNRGSILYTVDGDRIHFGAVALTRAMCPPESLSTIFVAHLEAVESFELVGSGLLLMPGTEGQTLIFAPADDT
ncbi:MAG TPA: META domain-containing protein [Spirillospora sp.]|nr:META domain-containing protein [Spirillospora sp.]